MNETEEERFARAAKKKRVDSLSDEVLNQFSEQAIKYVDPKTQEVKLRCKLCRKRDFRMVSSFEKHILEHKEGRIPTVPQQQQEGEETTDDPFNNSKQSERQKMVHRSKKQPTEHECSRCEQTFDSRTTLQAHFRKCVASPSVSPSKGSEKRKATLKAKEQMLRLLRGESDDDGEEEEEEEEEHDIIHEDEEHQMVTGAEEVVIQTEHSPVVGGATVDEEPMVAMQHDDTTAVDGAVTDVTELKFKIMSDDNHQEEGSNHSIGDEKQLSYQMHQTEHGIVDENTIHQQQQPYQAVMQQLSRQATDAETLAGLNITQQATSNEGEDVVEGSVIDSTNQAVVSNLQQMINDPESNAAALSYVMQCVNQAVIANEQQQQVLAAAHEEVSQTENSDILQTQVMTDDPSSTTTTTVSDTIDSNNELVVVSVPDSNIEGDQNKEIMIVMEQQQQQQSSDYDLQEASTDNNKIVTSETS